MSKVKGALEARITRSSKQTMSVRHRRCRATPLVEAYRAPTLRDTYEIAS